jgi:hypothetical protein
VTKFCKCCQCRGGRGKDVVRQYSVPVTRNARTYKDAFLQCAVVTTSTTRLVLCLCYGGPVCGDAGWRRKPTAWMGPFPLRIFLGAEGRVAVYPKIIFFTDLCARIAQFKFCGHLIMRARVQRRALSTG